MIQMAAEELGLPLDRIKLDIWNTDAVPFDSGVAGSWAARVNSAVVHEAAQAARQELIAFAARRLEWPAESIELSGDTIRSAALNESVRWKDMLAEANQAVTSGRKTQMSGLGEMSHITGFNAQVAEVEVDPDTGEIKLLNFVSAHDIGRILNPLGHQGQINGGIVAGIGYALMEEMRVEDGRVTNLSLGDYKLPTIARPAAADHGPARDRARSRALQHQGNRRRPDDARRARRSPTPSSMPAASACASCL